MKVSIYLKANLRRLIPSFTKSAKMRICPCVRILNTFFERNLFGSWIMFLKSCQCYESQYLPEGKFTQLDSPFYRICYGSRETKNPPLCWDSLCFFFRKPLPTTDNIFLTVFIAIKVNIYVKLNLYSLFPPFW